MLGIINRESCSLYKLKLLLNDLVKQHSLSQNNRISLIVGLIKLEKYSFCRFIDRRFTPPILTLDAKKPLKTPYFKGDLEVF